MKKIYLLLTAACAIAATVSCTKEITDPAEQPKPAEGFVAMQFTASNDLLTTKGYLDGKSVVWEVGETVAVYDGVASAANVFTVTAADENGYTLDGTVSETATEFYAVYPYSAANGFDNGTKSFNVTVSNSQTIPTGKSIDPAALVSVSKAEGSTFSFKNIVSLVQVTIESEDVNCVLLQGNASEAFSGITTVTADAVCASGSKKKAKIVPEGETFAPGTYYCAILPTTFADGIAVSATKATEIKLKTSSASVTFPRNGGFKLGNIESGAITLPLQISNKAELNTWAQNARYYNSDAVVELVADIDYEQGSWTPVSAYYGSFYGNGHSIYNISLVAAGNYAGFLANISVSSSFKDLKLGYNPSTSAYDGFSKLVYSGTDERPYLGAFAGYISAGTINLSNIETYVPITVTTATAATSRFAIGGIAGAMGSGAKITVNGCKNYGNISMNHTAKITGQQYIAGIAGLVAAENCQFENCQNYGSIEGAKSTAVGGHIFIGGIIGRVATEAYGISVKNCSNSGSFNTTKNIGSGCIPFIGGIIGADQSPVDGHSPKMTLTACSNTGKIACLNQTAGCSVAGIMGYMSGDSVISDCSNSGTIEKSGNMGDNAYIGGIVGKSVSGAANGIIDNCTNSGYVYEVAQTSKKTICIGGVIGISYTRLHSCTNTGKVEDKAVSTGSAAVVIGGISGCHAGAYAFDNCKNTGDVVLSITYANAAGGGLIGRMNNAELAAFEGCEVNCSVSSTTATIAGMIVGNYSSSPAVTFGSEASPIKVAGSFNGTALTAANYSDYIQGAANANATFHTVFLAE